MRLIATLLALTALLAAVPPAEARREPREERRESAQPRGVSLDAAVAQVRRETGGRVLAAETRGGVHRIKVLLPNGAVRVIHVDAASGAMQ